MYRQTISLDNGLLDVEIVDVSAESENEFPIDQIQWADSCLIVYSIIDRESFKYATKALGNLKSLQNGPSAYLIANKADLDHLREVNNNKLLHFFRFYNHLNYFTNSKIRLNIIFNSIESTKLKNYSNYPCDISVSICFNTISYFIEILIHLQVHILTKL